MKKLLLLGAISLSLICQAVAGARPIIRTVTQTNYENKSADADIFDFSSASTVSGSVKSVICHINDSTYYHQIHGKRNVLTVLKNRIFLTGILTNDYSLADSVAVCLDLDSIRLMGSMTSPFIYNGLYCNSVPISIFGECEVKRDSGVMLITPSNDSVSTTLITGKWSMSLALRSNDINDESLKTPALSLSVIDEYWFIDENASPIAHGLRQVYNDGESLGMAYFDLDAIEGSRHEKNSLKHQSHGDRSTESSHDDIGSDPFIKFDNYSGNLDISIPSMPDGYIIHGILTDAAGRVYYLFSPKTVAANETFNLSFDTSLLPPGDYVATVWSDLFRQSLKYTRASM